jgi:hypothetical protein
MINAIAHNQKNQSLGPFQIPASFGLRSGRATAVNQAQNARPTENVATTAPIVNGMFFSHLTPKLTGNVQNRLNIIA